MDANTKLRFLIRNLIKEDVDELQNHIFSWLDIKFNDSEKYVANNYENSPAIQICYLINDEIVIDSTIRPDESIVWVDNRIWFKLEKHFYVSTEEATHYLKKWIESRLEIKNINKVFNLYSDEQHQIDYSKY